MRIAAFKGTNRDFKAWLRDQRARMTRGLVSELAAGVESGKVVSLTEYRLKRTKRKNRSKRAARNSLRPSIA